MDDIINVDGKCLQKIIFFYPEILYVDVVWPFVFVIWFGF